MSLIDFIKDNFKSNFQHRPDVEYPNTLIHEKFGGCTINTRSGVKTLIKMLKPENILEIGSWHFGTSDQMGYSLDEIYGEDSPIGHVDSFDIKQGGYDGIQNNFPKSKRVSKHIWMPHKTIYDDWKETDQETKDSGFLELTNEQIFEKNAMYLQSIKPLNGYDIIYIDGDHSYDGVSFDWNYSKLVSNKNTLIILDDIWDYRLREVRRFFDDIKTPKWDFEEWNTENREKVVNMGVALL